MACRRNGVIPAGRHILKILCRPGTGLMTPLHRLAYIVMTSMPCRLSNRRQHEWHDNIDSGSGFAIDSDPRYVVFSATMEKTGFANVRNIIFDLDGTLIDSSAGVAEAVNFALTSLGQKPRTIQEIARFIGYPLDEMFPVFTDAPVEALKAAFQIRARESVVASAQPLDGVEALLPRIRAGGYRMAIATTKFSHHTEGIVCKFGWQTYFDALASGDEVRHVKPAPDIVRLALRRLGASPDETVVIGDTVNDVKAARAAGLRIIAIKSPFGADEIHRFPPDLMLESFADLAQVIKM